MLLNAENYSKGFLIDEELMAGVTEHPAQPGSFVAFVLKLETGEYLGFEKYSTLDDALAAIDRIPRQWIYEKSGGCGEGACGEGHCGQGECKTSSCPKGIDH
jgi:hypothetical protein